MKTSYRIFWTLLMVFPFLVFFVYSIAFVNSGGTISSTELFHDFANLCGRMKISPFYDIIRNVFNSVFSGSHTDILNVLTFMSTYLLGVLVVRLFYNVLCFLPEFAMSWTDKAFDLGGGKKKK